MALKRLHYISSVALLTIPVLVSACSSTEPKPGTGAAAQLSPSPAPVPTPSGPIEISLGRVADASVKFMDGESWDKNHVYEAYEKDLNIRLTNKWVSAQYDQKIKLDMASGDLPDIFQVSMNDMQKLADNGMIVDLTDIYGKNATALTKEFMTKDGGKQLNTGYIGGKMMGIPATSDPYIRFQYVWVRKDWLDKLQLTEPKTMQDLFKISEAFTKRDPDGNGKHDTFGLGIDKYLFDASYGLTGFFNGFHAYPNQWIKDASGKLVNGNVQPEMKEALKQLQKMFKNGEIDQEFGVKELDKANELAVGNRLGMIYGPFYGGAVPLQNAAVKDNKLVQDWRVYPIASVDDKPALSQLEVGVSKYYVVNKKFKYPEKAVVILNRYIEALQDQHGKGQSYFDIPDSKSTDYWKLNPLAPSAQDLTVKQGLELPEAIKTKDPSKLTNPNFKGAYDNEQKYLNGTLSYWGGTHMEFSDIGSLLVEQQYLKDKRYRYNDFYGNPTKTIVEKGATLDGKMIEAFTKIITGDASPNEFDSFVAQWSSLGGDDITKEVNEWYAAVNKR